jgi:hypothetical protein
MHLSGYSLGLLSFAVAGAVCGGPQVIALHSGPHLFIDDYLIESQSNLKRVVNQPKRLPEPVVTGKEDGCFQPYVTVVRDPVTRRFRIWYGVPESAGQTHLATMESDDGMHWIRPHRVLKDPAFIQFGTSIIDEGPSYPDPSKRYKWGWWAEGGLKVAASPDGIEWKMLAPGVVLKHDHDINSIHWDPIRKRYIALVSSYTTGDKWQGDRRIPMQSVSSDLIHWNEPWRVIEPDEKDEGETQFYCMSGVLARGSLLIGVLKVLRDEVVAEGAPQGAFGVGYTVLAWSRDGEHWTRDREPFLPRTPEPGKWDHAMTWGDCQLVVGDEVFIYYGGYMWGHKWERFTQRQIGLARMPLDRYVAREAGDERGLLRTPLLTLDAARMTVNADVKGGLQVRIVGEDGKPIPGFDWADCAVIRGDSLAHPVRWRKPLPVFRGEAVQIEFALRCARLYAFSLHRR